MYTLKKNLHVDIKGVNLSTSKFFISSLKLYILGHNLTKIVNKAAAHQRKQWRIQDILATMIRPSHLGREYAGSKLNHHQGHYQPVIGCIMLQGIEFRTEFSLVLPN